MLAAALVMTIAALAMLRVDDRATLRAGENH
jgi:hypothetical protein